MVKFCLQEVYTRDLIMRIGSFLVWNIKEEDERTDGEIAQDMVDYVFKHWEKSAHSNDLSHIREIEQDVRDFLQALLSNMREFHPSEVVFWEGLAKLENSYSFLKYASLLF